MQANEPDRSDRHRRARIGRSVVAVVVGATALLFVGSRCGGKPTPAPLSGLRWTDETPSWSPDGRAIVFASNRAHPKSGVDQLYLMSASGSGVRRLTWDGQDAREPSFAPDGRQIVYVGNVLDSSRDYTEASGIFTISKTGKDIRFLSAGLHGAADRPAWSPDGHWIAFVETASTRSGPNSRCDLYVVRRDGTHRHRLAINIDNWSQPLAWSPNGRTIAVIGGDERLYRISVNATRPVRVTADKFGVVATDITWSPDGTKIASVRGRIVVNSCFCDADGADVVSRHLWILDLRTRQQRRLRPLIDSGSVSDFGITVTWLRGRKPMLAAFDGDRTDLVSAAGRTIGLLTTPNGGMLTSGSASPRGRRLLFVDGPDNSYRSALFVADTPSGHLRQLTQQADAKP